MRLTNMPCDLLSSGECQRRIGYWESAGLTSSVMSTCRHVRLQVSRHVVRDDTLGLPPTAANANHHQCRVAGGGRCAAPTAWLRRASRVPLVNCSSPVKSGLSIEHRVYQGVVSSWDQEDDRPTNRCACEAPCAGTSLSSRVMCPKTKIRRAARISPKYTNPFIVMWQP